jgi:hypothetical protein
LAALLLATAFGLTGCIGAMQTQATDPVGAGGLAPTVEDKDVGLVGLRQGFDLKTYTVLAVDKLPISPAVINDDEDRKFAAAMPPYPRAIASLATNKRRARSVSTLVTWRYRRRICASTVLCAVLFMRTA